jgi:hypothetical protein
MSIIENIQQARNRNADDQTILNQIIQSNPDKADTFEEAMSRGADATQIVNQFLDSNQQEVKKGNFVTNLLKTVGKGVYKGLHGLGTATADVAFGATKRTADTLQNIGLATMRPIAAVTPLSTKGMGFDESVFERTNLAQKTGSLAATVAMYATGGKLIAPLKAKGVAAVPLNRFYTKLGQMGVKSASEFLFGGTVSLANEGELNDAVKTTAIISAMMPPLWAGAGQLKKSLIAPKAQAAGEKILTSMIRPNAADLKDGFKIQNITKHKLGSDIAQMHVNANVKLNLLGNKLNTALKDTPGNINLKDVYAQTQKQLQNELKSSFGDNTAIQRVLKQVSSEIDTVASNSGSTDIFGATLVKRGAGTKGAWAYGRTDPDAGAIEKVYNAFYGQLKAAIDSKIPPIAQKLNKEISELIPISNAVMRRIPVEMRNNIISLQDSVDVFSAITNPSGVALLGARKLSKSGRFANFLIESAKTAKNPETNPFFMRFLQGATDASN